MAKTPPLVPVDEIRAAFKHADGWRKQCHCARSLGVTRSWFSMLINGVRSGKESRPLDISEAMQRKISNYLHEYK